MERLDIHRIAAPHTRQHIDWVALDGLRRESPEIDQLIHWLNSCITNGRAEAFRYES